MLDNQVRVDYSSIPEAKKTDEGYFITKSPVTKVGVFKYLLPDGSVRSELRSDEEVFNKDSLNTMKMIPVTNNHPRVDGGLLDAVTAKEFTIGFSGEDVTHDNRKVFTNLKVTDIEGIGDIEAGKHEISCGYSCDLVEKEGKFDGEGYTHIQTNIKYNHIAIVNRGRAGREVKLRFDNAENVGVQLIEQESNMPKVTLDNGIQYDAGAEVVAHIDSLNGKVEKLEKSAAGFDTKLDEATKDLSKANAEKDVVQSKLDTLEKEMPEKIKEAVKTRVDLEGLAKEVLKDVKDLESKTDEDIKKEIVISKFPEAKLDDIDDAGLNVWLQASRQAKKNDSADNQKQTVFGGKKVIATDEDPVESAKQRQAKADEDAWKNKEDK